jgi:manganese transport protein
VAAAFIGPGTVVTASKAGAQTGCELLWAILLAACGAIVLQGFAARIGILTHMGLGEYLRAWLANSSWFRAVALLVIAALGIGNAAYQTGNLSGAAMGLVAVAGGELTAWICVLAIVSLAILSIGEYRWLQRILIGLVALLSLSFFITSLLSLPDLSQLASGLLVPRVSRDSLALVVALIGTTIVPYNLFLHASSAARNWADMETSAALRQARWDTSLSIGLGGLVTAAILVTANAAFFARGIPLGELGDIAHQLSPVVGSTSGALFGVGIFAAGLTSSITAPLATAFAICGILGWSPTEHRGRFRGIAYAVVCVGTTFAVFSGRAPAETILAAQLANGLLLPIVAAILLWTASQQAGAFAPQRWQLALGWGVVGLVALLAGWKIVTSFL